MKHKPKDKSGPFTPPDSPAKGRKQTPNPGMPQPSTIISEENFISSNGTQYLIIRTNQKDEYDETDPDDPKE